MLSEVGPGNHVLDGRVRRYRCRAAAGLQVWNSLPAELRQCDTRKQFKRHLNAHFFGYGTPAICDFC